MRGKAAVETAQAWTDVTVMRIYVDKGYRRHALDCLKVWRSGNRAPTEATRRELRRRPSRPGEVPSQGISVSGPPHRSNRNFAIDVSNQTFLS